MAAIRQRLAEGGEVAQQVVRDLFPAGIWLSVDPEGQRFLWATAQTELPADWITHVDAKGYLPAEYWPRVYSAEASAGMVAGAGFEPATFGL